ncbi:MAG: hypothetical protein KGZ25_12270, partial [Planctomycetes bacterium]|nr:hypothetical protein [Planctomycetota bacterium]
ETRIYVDGQRESVKKREGFRENGEPVLIGVRDGETDFYRGYVDNVAIFHESLTDQNVMALSQCREASSFVSSSKDSGALAGDATLKLEVTTNSDWYALAFSDDVRLIEVEKEPAFARPRPDDYVAAIEGPEGSAHKPLPHAFEKGLVFRLDKPTNDLTQVRCTAEIKLIAQPEARKVVLRFGKGWAGTSHTRIYNENGDKVFDHVSAGPGEKFGDWNEEPVAAPLEKMSLPTGKGREGRQQNGGQNGEPPRDQRLSKLQKSMTPKQVEVVLGKPMSRLGSGNTLIWSYTDGTRVRFKGGKLVGWEKTSPASKAEQRRKKIPEKETDEPQFFLLTVMTKTGDGKKHGTDDGVAIRVNGLEELKKGLDNGGNDRERSAIDRYNNLRIEYPLSKVRFVEIVFNGDDAWFLEKVGLQFTRGDKRSRVYSFDVERWMSTQGQDRRNPEMRALLRLKLPVRPVLDRPAK